MAWIGRGALGEKEGEWGGERSMKRLMAKNRSDVKRFSISMNPDEG